MDRYKYTNTHTNAEPKIIAFWKQIIAFWKQKANHMPDPNKISASMNLVFMSSHSYNCLCYFWHTKPSSFSDRDEKPASKIYGLSF